MPTAQTNQNDVSDQNQSCSSNLVCIPIQFMRELSSSQTALDIIKIVAHWFYEIFEAERASITLSTGDSMLSVIALEGNDAIPIGVDMPIDCTMVGRVFTTGKTECCNDLSQSEDIDCRMLLNGNIMSCLDVPLTKNDLCFGTINVGRSKKNAFNDADILRLESVAHLVSALMYIDRLTDQLRIIADTDSLTGILNRRAFLKQFGDACREKRRSRGHGIALIDLDHFKRVNDAYGHNAGDKVLIQFCRILRMVFRSNDLIARFWGEEFCIFASDITYLDFKYLLNRLLDILRSTPIDFAQGRIQVTASIGAVHTKRLINKFDKIYAQADKALYCAKNGGRDRVELVVLVKEPASGNSRGHNENLCTSARIKSRDSHQG